MLFVNFILMIQDGHFSSGVGVCSMVSFVAVCCNHKVGIAFQILTLGVTSLLLSAAEYKHACSHNTTK